MNPLRMLKRKTSQHEGTLTDLHDELTRLRETHERTLQAIALLVETVTNGFTTTGAALAPKVEQIHGRVVEALVQAGESGLERGRITSFAERFGGDGVRTAPLVLARLILANAVNITPGRVTARPEWIAARNEANARRNAEHLRGMERPSVEERMRQIQADQDRAELLKYGEPILHLARVLGVTPAEFQHSFIFRLGEPRESPGYRVSCYHCAATSKPFAKWSEVRSIAIEHNPSCEFVIVQRLKAERAAAAAAAAAPAPADPAAV